MDRRHRLKVLSYNIHKGFNANNRRFILRRIRDAIREVHADLVFLQEVLGHHSAHSLKFGDWPKESQFEFLADELWPHFAYGKNAVYTSGHHGNAILSKYPITFWENIDISTNRLEQRGLLHAILDVPGRHKPLHALCVHMGLLEAERREQVRRLCDRIESHVPHDDPVVIGGDFNDWTGRAARPLQHKLDVQEAFMTLHGSYARTYPSWLPALRLDRIYYRGMNAGNAKCLTGLPWNSLSDHAALFVELTI
jgi:endonuclease/exonuclease/phosphatase family metal-dependent hydrolase